MKVFLILVFVLVSFVGMANAQVAEKLLVSVSLQTGENNTPIISGVIKNEEGDPIGDTIIQISSVVGMAETKSDTDGKFVYNMPILPTGDKFNIGVKAQKEGYLAGYANTSFFVRQENQTSAETKPIDSGFKVVTTDKIKNDPIAFKILQNIELNKQKEEERQKRLQEIEARQKFIEEQRQLANQDLLVDLQSMFEQFDPFNPRNVFSSFVSGFDSTIQNIYWGQFNFTETKTKEGLVALEQVLNSGGTMQDARNAFYETAAISQYEINKLNDELNAKYAKNDTRSRPDGEHYRNKN
jgi:hypothetical protein